LNRTIGTTVSFSNRLGNSPDLVLRPSSNYRPQSLQVQRTTRHVQRGLAELLLNRRTLVDSRLFGWTSRCLGFQCSSAQCQYLRTRRPEIKPPYHPQPRTRASETF